MNSVVCRRCAIHEGVCVLCGLAEHARCFGEFHRCDGGIETVKGGTR